MDRIENEYGKIFTSYTFCHNFYEKKKLYINMLDTSNSIGEIVFFFQKKKWPQHKENILLRVNKISMNCHYIKSSLLIGVFFLNYIQFVKVLVSLVGIWS